MTSSRRTALIRHLETRCLQSEDSKTGKGKAGEDSGGTGSRDGLRLAGGLRDGAVGVGRGNGGHESGLALVASGLGLGEGGSDGGLASGLLSRGDGLGGSLGGRDGLGGLSRGGLLSGLTSGLGTGVLAESLDGGENLVYVLLAYVYISVIREDILKAVSAPHSEMTQEVATPWMASKFSQTQA